MGFQRKGGKRGCLEEGASGGGGKNKIICAANPG